MADPKPVTESRMPAMEALLTKALEEAPPEVTAVGLIICWDDRASTVCAGGNVKDHGEEELAIAMAALAMDGPEWMEGFRDEMLKRGALVKSDEDSH